MYEDCTENIKQNSLRNMFPVNTLKHNRISAEKGENSSVVTLNERFTKRASFPFLSERFKKSKLKNNETSVRHMITENHRKTNNILKQPESTKIFATDSEDEIFSQSTIKANSNHQISNVQRKRVLEAEETNSSNRKRNKTAILPIKGNGLYNNLNVETNDFNFKKTKMPVRKISNVKKDAIPEILIAKSRQPLAGNLEFDLSNSEQDLVVQNKDPLENTAEVKEPDCSNQTEVTQNTTDVSMKSSFLKRKRFTQKLDVVENNNISNDNFATNEPIANSLKNDAEKTQLQKKRIESNYKKYFRDNDSESDVEKQTGTSWTSEYQVKQGQKKRIKSIDVKRFWDSDYESDMETKPGTHLTSEYQVKQDDDIHKTATQGNSNMNNNKKSLIKRTIPNVRSFQHEGVNSSMRYDLRRVRRKKSCDYCRRQREINKNQKNDNKTMSKNTKPTHNDKKKVKEQVVPSTKPQKTSGSKSNLSKVSNKKSNSKPIPTKEIKSKKQIAHNNECNTSRESLRLQQKKKQFQKKRRETNYKKSFWDTDSESDMETQPGTHLTSEYQVKQDDDIHKNATQGNSNIKKIGTYC